MKISGYEPLTLVSEKALAELYEVVEKLKRGSDNLAEERIPCPIQMEYHALKGGDGLAIPFPDGKRSLWYHDNAGDCLVTVLTKPNLVDCVLIPCKREDLKEGDTAFRWGNDPPDFNHLWGYCKIKKHNIHIFIVSSGGVGEAYTEWDNWYKVVVKNPKK